MSEKLYTGQGFAEIVRTLVFVVVMGENDVVTPGGTFEIEKLTGWLNPFRGVSKMVVAPEQA